MWKIDSDGNAYNECGERIWLVEERGHLKILRTVWNNYEPFRGFTKHSIVVFPKNFSAEDAREFLFRRVDFLNLRAQLPQLTVKQIWAECDARARDRKKLKMLSLWAQ